MSRRPRALLLGGTGAIGVYLAPLLHSRGFAVDVTSRVDRSEGDENIKYIKGDAQNEDFLTSLLSTSEYDVVIDFMVYRTEEFSKRVESLLARSKQYIYLSSYRVFADASVINERSDRLLDTVKDQDYLDTDEYALAKARQEDILRQSSMSNWTIVRPAITYSKSRYQLGVLEAESVLWRAFRRKAVIIADDMLDKVTTMTWAGDVAEMIARLVLNDKAYGEDFNVATDEHHTWREVSEIYQRKVGLKLKAVTLREYLNATQSEYQVRFDRMYDRKIDNRKVVAVTGYTNFKTLNEGLGDELDSFSGKKIPSMHIDYALQARIDRVVGEVLIDWREMSKADIKQYLKARFPILVKVARGTRSGLSTIRTKLRIRSRLYQLRELVDKVWYNAIRTKDVYRSKRIDSRTHGATVTLIDYSNYGNVIQRFALQEFLYRKGLNFISYEHKLPIGSDVYDPKHANIVEFVDRYIVRREVDVSDNFSAYVVGSDQVWRNWSYKKSLKDLGFFFLDFTEGRDVKRIAYAASFGKSTLEDALVTDKLAKQMKPYVDKFSAISMREKSGIDIVKKVWGRQSQEVIDPTLLLKKSDYDRVIRHSLDKKTPVEGIFVYILGPTEENRALVERTASSMGCGVNLINPYHEEVIPSVAVWLKSIRDAELVITDSFHSTVFAIINNTQFIVVENQHGGIGRIEDLLLVLGISSDRIIRRHKESQCDVENMDSIDWTVVNKRLALLRDESGAWLMDAIRK